jgi:hypothetical protein
MSSTAEGGTGTTSTQRKTPNGDFRATHIDEDLKGVSIGSRENELFFNCELKDLRGVTLKNCVLTNSRVLTDRVEDALGLTVTLDCHTFEDLELSPLMFDLLLVLLLKTKGNEEKRRKLVEVIGRRRVVELLGELKQVER